MPLNDVSHMFRSPSPGEDSDEDEDDYYQEPSFNPIARALDLDLRADSATYKETPFTIAAQRKNLSTDSDFNKEYQRSGATRSGIKVAVDRSRPPPREPTPPSSTKLTIRRPVDRPGRFRPPPISRRRNNTSSAAYTHPSIPKPKPKVRSRSSAVAVKPASRPRKNNDPAEVASTSVPNSGWLDGMGNPIPKDPPRKRSILDRMEEDDVKKQKKDAANAKRRETYRRKKEAKEAKEAAEKISFGRLPANSAPNDDFPIMLGFEKQKALPTKASAKASTIKGKGKGKEDSAEFIDTESKTHLTPEEVDLLFAKNSPSIDNARMSSDDTLTQANDSGLLATLAIPDVFKRFDQDLDLIKNDKNKPLSSQPLTITHLDSSALEEIEEAAQGVPPSSVLPYSSPLAMAQNQAREKELLGPRPRRQGEDLIGTDQVTRLERSAEGEDFHVHEASKPQNRTRSPHSALSMDSDEDFRVIETPKPSRHQNQLQTPQRTPHSTSAFGSNQARIATSRIKPKPNYEKYRNKDLTTSSLREDQEDVPEWSTFVPSKKRKNSLAAKGSNTNRYETPKRCPDKFRAPVNLFPRKLPPADLFKADTDLKTATDETSEEPVLSKPRLTLFKPTPPQAIGNKDNGYTIVTNRGSRYGAAASTSNYDVATNFIDLPKPSLNQRQNMAPQAYRLSPLHLQQAGRTPSQSLGNPSLTHQDRWTDGANYNARRLSASQLPFHHFSSASTSQTQQPRYLEAEEAEEDGDAWERAWERPNAAY